MAELVLVLGGVRSGKSAVAEGLVATAPGVVYVATGAATDAEMAARIAAHRARRPETWQTVETADPAAAVRAAPPGSAVLVDALGTWLAARLDDDPDELLAEADALLKAAQAHDGGPVVVVAEEAGLGVVPTGAATRRWLDLLGEAKQRLAAAASRSLLVVAGAAIPLPARPPASSTGTHDLSAHGDRMVPDGALDFAVNVHADAPPSHVRAALDAALDRAGRYPDEASAAGAVARRHRRPRDEVLVTAGAAEAFAVLARVVAARDAVIVHPSFTQPEEALVAAGIPVRHVLRDPGDGWRLDPGRVGAGADLVVVGNPNNPTGTLDEPDRVAALCRPGRVTIVDEAFVDFVEDEAAVTLAGRRDLPGLVVVRSVTKLWALAGVRAGYLLGPPGLVARCAAARPPWSTSAVALAALEACADDEAYRRSVAAQVADTRRRLMQSLATLPGVNVHDSAANFLLLDVPDGPAVHAGLLERGIAVRPSTFPGLSLHSVRVAVRDPATNDLLVDALRAVLSAHA
jgi:histidinol-phosphate/aromatic aminotransferase/cobyric acid decarboxylase-like protein/adenosyl cobinamide kinase/adenosyl cobinamide phosphate guanylyltransferase